MISVHQETIVQLYNCFQTPMHNLISIQINRLVFLIWWYILIFVFICRGENVFDGLLKSLYNKFYSCIHMSSTPVRAYMSTTRAATIQSFKDINRRKKYWLTWMWGVSQILTLRKQKKIYFWNFKAKL